MLTAELLLKSMLTTELQKLEMKAATLERCVSYSTVKVCHHEFRLWIQ